MCLNKPVTIPVGSDGLSVFIAYAQDSSGTGASFTPSSARDYISFVTKSGAASLTDFTIWTLFQGNDGTNGTNGTGISSVYVSDGTTAIGGTVYVENTVVVLMTTGIYINAGVIQTSLTWNSLTMINGWTSGTGLNIAQYAIKNGFIYFRGTINATSSTASTFASIPSAVSSTILTIIGDNITPTVIHTFEITSSSDLKVRTQGTSTYLLDSVPPISIR
jgi:hypothetical protein